MDAGMGAGKMGEAQGGGAPTQNVRRWGCKMSMVLQKGKEESFKNEKGMLLLLLSRFSRVRLCATP